MECKKKVSFHSTKKFFYKDGKENKKLQGSKEDKKYKLQFLTFSDGLAIATTVLEGVVVPSTEKSSGPTTRSAEAGSDTMMGSAI